MSAPTTDNFSDDRAVNTALSVLIYSPIPVVEGQGFLTLDLWAQDLNAQVKEGVNLILFCEVLQAVPTDWQGSALLNTAIKVVGIDRGKKVEKLLAGIGADLFQVPGNMQWQHSGLCRDIVSLAKSLKIPVVVGISSNRAKTQILNAAGKSWLKRWKAYLQALSIRFSQFYLTSLCDGAFIVGDGLRHLVSPFCKNLHVNVASWITQAQIKTEHKAQSAPPLKLAVAARLEPMKGIHLAIEALKFLVNKGYAEASLDILGEGPEKQKLVALADSHQLSGRVKFLGTFAYPSPFLEVLENYGLILVTNLNDEQPRIVFDALSRGIIPVCPDRTQFRALDLPAEILFAAGDAESLADKLAQLSHQDVRESVQIRLSSIIQEYTLENMHRKRKLWMIDLIGSKRPA